MLLAFYCLIVVLYLQTFGPRMYYNIITSVDSRAGPRRYYNAIILLEPDVVSGTAGINTYYIKVV